MFRILFVLLFLFVTPYYASSQILPREGSILNYRLVGFSLPQDAKQNNSYKIEIAAGNHSNSDSFNNHIIKTVVGKKSRIIAEVPSFGTSYTWRISYVPTNYSSGKPQFYHFSTGSIPDVDTGVARLRIIKGTDKYRNSFVFLDNSKVLYDMNGNPVWFVPEKIAEAGPGISIRDLKITPQGTITFLGGNDSPCEISYDGDILWKGPDNGKVSGAPTENYHHEFTRLANGHYMVLGNENAKSVTGTFVAKDGQRGSGQQQQDSSSFAADRLEAFGTVIEYDEKGSVVWSWKSSEYFQKSDLKYYVSPTGTTTDVHENAFFFDEKNKMLYVSFKNISRIVKVKYPEGIVVNSFGEIYKPGTPVVGNGLFCHQHACKRAQIGCLFLFNNNGCSVGANPKVKMLMEPTNSNENLRKVWEYECVIGDGYPKVCPSGGNVMELKDSAFFVSMGGGYGKMFIVTLDKKELWSALSERYVKDRNEWLPVGQYRASIIETREQLERLIWRTDRKANRIVGAIARKQYLRPASPPDARTFVQKSRLQ